MEEEEEEQSLGVGKVGLPWFSALLAASRAVEPVTPVTSEYTGSGFLS